MADIQIAVIDEKDTQIALAVPGIQGPAGAISSGGSANQVFYKVSSTNYDAGWTFIGNANVDASAEIAVSKLADGSARQLLQTDAAGTGVEWASNIDIPGTLDVTSAATFDSTVAVTGALTKSGSNVVTVGDTGTVTSTMILDGTISNADINASAAIVDTKLATITTASKVSNSATTATNANTASAIVARDASGNFTAGTITAALTGAASSNVLKAGDTMTGALVHPLGAVATPSISFTGDLNTGIYSPGADQLAVATNGVERVEFGNTEVVFNDGGADVDFRVEGDTKANLFFVDAGNDRIQIDGPIGVGGANFGTTGQALISNGSSAVPTWQDLNTAVFGWDHDNDTYGLYLPGTSISTGALSGTINIDVQSRIRRCVINNSGVVQYYLDADDSTNKSADWLRIVETESLATAYTGAPAAEATNSLLRVGVPAWAAGTFTRGQRVTNGGYLWECVAASSTATPAAGAVASVLDGTDGQVVVEIPAFSVRYGFINGVHTREVRLGCNDGLIAQGFRPHPAFIKTDGTYKSAFYWGAYQAYSDGTNLASVSGQTNTRSLTRATFRTRAALRGTGWHVQSYLELAAVQTLLVTEYRDYNSQKVLGNGSSEGATYGVATGLSNSRGNRSGNVYTGGGSSSDFMSYRGIENLYGRAWTWADGINVYERVVYLTNNQLVFADNTSVGYSFYAQVPSGSGSFQKELFPLADVFLPSVVTGASGTTYLADGFWTGSGWRVARVGGSSVLGSIVGAFCLYLSYASGDASDSLGARSAYAAN